MNTRNTLLALVAATALVSCGGDPAPTLEANPCNCYQAMEKAEANYASILDECKVNMNEKAFVNDYARCKIADIRGVSVDEIPAITPKEQLELSDVDTGAFAINPERSSANWTGTKITGNKHFGSVKIKEGTFNIEGNTMTAARIVLDMTTIQNRDLESEEERANLVGHLMSADFFDAEKHPEAVFELTEPATIENNRTDAVGTLTVRGITKPLTISGLNIADLKKFVAVTGAVTFNRTDYNASFGSGLAGAIGDNIINDDVAINFSLTANAQ